LLDANDAPTNVFSNSNVLTVASGRPVQRSLSLAFEKLSIEGANTDGEEATVTLSMADRQGNPVPPGTQVNFVSESGVILPAVCFVPPVTPATASSPAIPTSFCTVKIRSQGARTANGRVSVLAYVEGEEDFVDVNGNNVYDASTDSFKDLGRAFRDDNANAVNGANGVYDTGEFQVPRVSVPACVAGAGCAGDGAWGAADVRTQGSIVFASSNAVISGAATATTLNFTVADANGNSMPTGSKVEVTGAIGNSSGTWLNCTIQANSSFAIANTVAPTITSSPFLCDSGDILTVKVTSPLGFTTSQDFIVP
jgi:hypothetical protein